MTIKRLVLLPLTASLLAVPAAPAAQWYLNPSLSVHGGYNDNIRLTTGSHNAVEELTVSPELAFGRRTAISNLSGSVGVDSRHFWGEDGLNTTDRHLDLSSHYNSSPLTIWRLDGNITRDTTLQSELSDTGVVLQRSPRLKRSISPSWQYQWNRKTRLQLGYQYQGVSYPEGTTAGFQDYKTNTANGSLTYLYDQRNQISGSVAYTDYRTTNGNVTARYAIAQFGGSHAFSQVLSANLAIGWRRTDTTLKQQRPIYQIVLTSRGLELRQTGTTTREISNSNNGYVLSGGLTRKLETGKLSATVSRNIQPTAYGGVIQTDRLGLSAKRRYSRTFGASLDLSYYRTRAVSTSVSGLDRNFIRVEPAAHWKLSRWWTIRADYRYTRQQYKNQSTTATQNAFYVTARYDWPRIAVSR